MPDLPSISDAEWDIMKVLWQCSPLTAGQIVERLSTERKWHPRTVKTLIGRLVRKGAIAVSVEDRRYLYRPRITQAACRRQETRSFLDRVFDGAVAPAVVQFLKNADLSPREIEELRRILDQEKP